MIFISSCAIEYTCNTWGSTFLVNVKGVAVDRAAEIITFYYIGMTLGRFLSGVFSGKISSWNLIRIGQCIILAAVILLVLPLPAAVCGVALFLVGLGNGPLFPNLVHLTPKNFGKEISQSVMGTQMAAASAGTMIMPPIFGFIAERTGLGLFPYYLLALFLIMALSIAALIRRLKKEGRYSFNG